MIIIYELTVRAEIRKSESEAQAVAGRQPPSVVFGQFKHWLYISPKHAVIPRWCLKLHLFTALANEHSSFPNEHTASKPTAHILFSHFISRVLQSL